MTGGQGEDDAATRPSPTDATADDGVSADDAATVGFREAGSHLPPEDAPTTVLPVLTPPANPSSVPDSTAPDPSAARGHRRVVVGALAGVAVACAALYVADLAFSSDRVPRGVVVAGVPVGGETRTDAEALLRAELGPRVDQPVPVTAGDVQAEVVPRDAGLDVDWSQTLDRAGDQPLNPVTRLTSLFTHRDVPVVSVADEPALAAAVEALRAVTDRAAVEGGVVFDAADAVPVSPRPGQSLDAAGAAAALAAGWADPGGATLPVETVAVTVTEVGVDRALTDVAKPAVSADLVVTGRDRATAVLGRDRIGAVLSFVPDGRGGLTPRYDVDAAIGVLAPQLTATEIKPKDAGFSFASGRPAVVPAVTGEMIEWHKTLSGLPELLTRPDPRTVAAVYEPRQPELTTEAAGKLGITEVIGEFTSGGFEYASGVNIRLAAGEIDGALVKPGETFSLNGHTGTRGAAQGYVESGIIDKGRPGKAVGGGISQLATTLYNAAYFAGMEDAGHTEHSYYISRYPAAREATVFDGAIDLKFRNPGPNGVLIETVGTGSDITVRLWGTKRVDVESVTGSRYAPTTPNTVTLPKGPGCVPSAGAPGFTTSDTRILTDSDTGQEISRNTRTVKYDPVPVVKCE